MMMVLFYLPALIQVAVVEGRSRWPVSAQRAAFVSPSPSTRAITGRPTTTSSSVAALHATKSAIAKNKKNKKKGGGGGGFGSSSATATKNINNKSKPKYGGDDGPIAFPELEKQVLQTLVPSPVDGSDESLGRPLSEEMYDRLEDIYGLDKFNFGGIGAIYKSIGVVGGGGDGSDNDDGSDNGSDSDGSSLFNDILSGGAASQSSSSPLDDLLSPSSTLSTPSISLGDVLESASDESSSKDGDGSGSYDLTLLPPFDRFRVLHTDPMVLAIDDFFTHEECDRYVQISLDSEAGDAKEENDKQPMLLGQSQTVGKDSRSKAQRTSTTWFHHYEGVPELMARASRLLGLEDGIRRFEEPQTVRYRRNERFTWHLDALAPDEATKGAGQRFATLLVYLTDLSAEDGGATMFRDLGGEGGGPLKVRPKKGSALLFFPSAGGIPDAPFDVRTLHCGEAVGMDSENEKWIAQLWLRRGEYEPTAPPGNAHGNAYEAIGRYCDSAAKET